MSAADPLAGLCTYLLTTDVAAAVSDRVFRPDLPASENKQMPRACVVARPAGGYNLFGGGNVPLADPRVDLRCYGATAFEAYQVALAVCAALRALRRSVHGGCTLHWAKVSGGPLALRDPDTLWPYSLVTAQVAHLEPAV